MKKLLIIALSFFSTLAAADTVTVYKSPTCGCCKEWAGIMQQTGYDIKIEHPFSLSGIKRKYNVPSSLESCHTAIINGYVFEGHIPPADIKAFLDNPPKGAKGLAAPGMPAKSPGMARPGESYKNFSVVQFDEKGQMQLFNRY